jgi:kynureninase
MELTLQDCMEMDRTDPLASKRKEFALPDDKIYLDGNSLGALPLSVRDHLRQVVEQQWGEDLISSWDEHNWIGLPQEIGAKIAPLIGAKPGEVIASDSTSVNMFKLLITAMVLNRGRGIVLSSRDNFPTDLYMAQGVSKLLGEHVCNLRLVDEANLIHSINEDTAVVLLTQVNFRTGRLLDMEAITRQAHKMGALVIWDLSHSVGVVPINLGFCEVDLAVGCGYKFLNGGPGAPAFVYLAEKHQNQVSQPLYGWMGHEDPFAFSPDYRPGEGMLNFLCGTPPVLSMTALDKALDIWGTTDIQSIRDKSTRLTELFLQLVEQQDCLSELKLVSPRNAPDRGSQLTYSHENAELFIQSLAQRNVIADYRASNLMRFGFAPLYTRYQDAWAAVDELAAVVMSHPHNL